MRGIILGKLPDQLKLPFYLWTRQAVAQLAKRECGVDLSPTTVGRYLKAWGMTPQKPVRRAYERNDAAIAAWLAEQYTTALRLSTAAGNSSEFAIVISCGPAGSL